MQQAEFIVWDLGATKCAAAVVCYQDRHFEIKKQCQCKLLEFDSLTDLIAGIEAQLDISLKQADAICIAGAGQYNGTELILDKSGKGYPYPMLFSKVEKEQGWRHLFVVHDYTPIICRT